jgi:methyl-accepting chemotaxis protein
MKNLKIGIKLVIGFGLLLALTIIIAVVSVISISHINNNYTYVLDYPNDRYSILRDLESDLSDLRRIVVQASFELGNVAAVDSLQNEANAVFTSIQAIVGAYTQSIWRDTEIDDATRNAMLSELSQLEQLIADYSRHVSAPTFAAARADNYNQVSALLPLNTSISDDISLQFMGLFVLAQDHMDAISNEMSALSTNSMWIVIVLAGSSLVIGVIIALLITKSITKPIDEVVSALSDVADGNLNARNTDLYKNRTDEIGKLFDAYINVIDWLNEISGAVETLANGDLDIDVKVRSEHDALNKSIQKMIDSLNGMFGEINNASGQVSAGSKQLAEGAQTLAQGSTKQAASVQQLSASISDIAAKTKENAELAGRAADLANNIKSSAEKGSGQMDDMMSAVRDINESSQNIGKVIKSIDDIAFQTNILALNAAVEAARAGQHGKGFAVVAEEVRNLAAKSAEAAKDTETLIADSISKAELGSRIADDTAASLKEIVEGIDESTRLVGDIARSSEEQSIGISQVNTGVDEVAQVVQQTSATAEESAATSQEMSEQAHVMEELISRFKLKNSLGNFLGAFSNAASLPPAHAASGSSSASFDGDFGKY